MKLQRSIIFLVLLVIIQVPLLSQKKEVALVINGKEITKNELQRDYSTREQTEEKESVQDFIDSYILKKLILEEAVSQRIDSTEAYRREFNLYTSHLLDSYLRDTITAKELVDRIVDRFDYELELNHAYVPFESPIILAKDTISAYQKSIMQRNVAQKEGFSKVEKEIYSNSFGVVMDVNTETGYVGWIRPLMFSVELDDVIFSLDIGEISMPVRDRSGYHIFQVIAKRPAQSIPVVEQVMFNFPTVPPSKEMIDSIYSVAIKTYDEIEIRDNFQEICDEFSAVFKTGDRGCLLGKVNLGEKIPYNLISGAYALGKIGDVSKPILTDYGYHILRLKGKSPIPSSDAIRKALIDALASPELLPTLKRNERRKMLSEVKVDVNKGAYSKLLNLSENYIPHDSAFFSKVTNKNDVLLKVENKYTYTVQNFLSYIESSSWIYTQEQDEQSMVAVKYKPIVEYSLSTDILNNYFDQFMYGKALQYKKEHIQQEDVSYRDAVNKLSQGLLYTALMNKEVWRKTKTDYEGLQNIFLKNRSKYKLQGEFFKGMIIHAKSAETIEEIEKQYANSIPSAKALRQTYNQDHIEIDIDEGLWQKGDDAFVDAKIYQLGDKTAKRNFPYYTVVGKFITTPHDFRDVKSQVEMDYQKELESEWISKLKNKYRVEVNNDVIKTIR